MQAVLETGTLKVKTRDKNAQPQQYVMTLLGEEHLPQIMGLQGHIVQNLSHPDLFAHLPQELMKAHFGPGGFTLGVFVDDRLIAFRNVYFPNSRENEWNLGLDIGFAAEQSAKFANLQMVCVHPDFRGNALALKMNRRALALLQHKGTCEHVCATVSPYNVWNIRVLLNCGFRMRTLKMKYGGKLRYIVYQNLRTPLDFSDEEAVYARLDDLDAQKEIFHSGRYGVALAHLEELDNSLKKDLFSHSLIIFKRPSDPQVVHVVKRRAKVVANNRVLNNAPWNPPLSPAGRWDLVGDPSVTLDGLD